MRKTVNINTLRTRECLGRLNQVSDPKNVKYLKELREAGIEFAEPIEVTTDGVVVKGHNRSDAERQFLARLPEEQQMVTVEMLPISWDDSDETAKNKLVLRAYKDNVHTKGKAANHDDLQGVVAKLIEADYTDKQIIAALQPEVSAYLTRKAIVDHHKAISQSKYHMAVDLRAKGMSVKKALETAGLPPGTELPEPGEKKTDRDRLHKLGDAADKMCASWYNFADRRLTNYYLTGQGQAVLTAMAERMVIAAATLTRKAKNISEQVNVAIETRAKRERRVPASV